MVDTLAISRLLRMERKDDVDRWVNRVICGDALEVMREMPDGCVDLVLTDPPYGLAEKMSNGGTWATNPIYREVPNWDSKISTNHILEIFRVSKNQVIWGGHLYRLPLSRCWLAWVKTNPVNTMGDFELAWTSYDKPPKKFTSAINPAGEQRIHPTQKPVKLGGWILKNYSNSSEIILDCFGGSGSFIVAAARLGHPWIYIDSNPDYCRMAEERIGRETAQRNMFHTKGAK